MRFLSLLLLWLGMVGCEHGHCHRLRNRAQESPPTTAPMAETSSPTQRTVKVYKYDGSLQCGQGTVVSLETMAKELKQLKIYSSFKKSDGLMHIQVCGSPTGQANIFEISELDWPVAEKLGFKKWSFE